MPFCRTPGHEAACHGALQSTGSGARMPRVQQRRRRWVTAPRASSSRVRRAPHGCVLPIGRGRPGAHAAATSLPFGSMAVVSSGPFWTRRPRVRPPRHRFLVLPLFPAPCQRSVERMARSTIWNPFDIIIYFQARNNCPSISRL